MLVLSRKINEKLLFPGIQAAVQVVAIKSGVVRLGVEAPPEVAVLRAELQGPTGGTAPAPNRLAGEAAGGLSRELAHLLRNRLNAAAIGLALLRRQRQLGLAQESDSTLDQVDREIQELRRHLEGAAERPSPRPPARPARRRKALLVEDDGNERELLAGFLRLAGLDVDTAADGADTLDYLRAGSRPDVVLLDMVLPRCDGPTTLREIRRDPACAGLKVFAVSGHPPERFAAEAGAGDVSRWFRKPVNPEELLRELEREVAAVA
jgi:two-component system, OmpR family, response regulator